MRSIRSITGVVALSLASIPLAACGGGATSSTAASVATPVPSATPVALGPVDPALVGTWQGSINGSVGVGALTMSLAADGSMSADATGSYCRATGRWGVSSGQFAARGEECQGYVVTFTAAASNVRLSGTWIASGGARGQFDLTR